MSAALTAKRARSAKVLRTFCTLLGFAGGALLCRDSVAAELFPFVLPWDDAAPSITDVSSWLEKPAGSHGFVTVKNGHLFAGEKRFRIFGVNVAFGANFPTHADAEKVAGRMAKFGINCVRFHHMDMQPTPSGIFAKDGRTLDPEQLDRLDYFIAQLKAHGIYSDLNLHVSRTYPDRPKAEKVGNPNYDKGVDNFAAGLIELQKQYARDLLTHLNPYTKSAYFDEPAIALVEINNENALLDEWNHGGLDKLAEPYREELSALWAAWLREKYKQDVAVTAAWSTGAKGAGPELLKNAHPSVDLKPWTIEQHSGAIASGRPGDGGILIDVTQPGSEPWHVQMNQAGIVVADGESYAATFQAKADPACTISVNLGQTREPYKVLASQTVALTPEWQRIHVVLKPSGAEENARFSISGLGAAKGKFAFGDMSLTAAALDGSLPSGAFTKSEYAARTPAAQEDWYRFLWTLEERYWPGMYRFIREELKSKSLIVGTQLGWSPAPIQAKMDVIDSHAYWQHPKFPNKQWDMNDWTVKNVPMAGAADGGTLPALALQRVAEKPYICTEYNHAAPNSFASETFPLICAYAALQDWDGVFAFAYSHRRDDWRKGYFPSFFDIDQHPTKMATLPASVALFMRGDVAAAHEERFAGVTADAAFAQARKSGPRFGADRFGVDRLAAFVNRVGVKLDGPASRRTDGGKNLAKLASDTGELLWNTEDRVVTINTARSKGVLGFVERRNYELGDVKIEVGAAQQGWATVQLTVMSGEDFRTAKRVLVTATGVTENTSMKWGDDTRSTVGRDWGHAPSLVEGIAATLHLPQANLKAWALDERGQRRVEVPVREGVLEIGPEHRTLWYELAAE